uniref:Uncharacterized protein n=1 Tax=Populus alba TaxID=43335 RepID=A0A4U5QIA4_POPAL|nr:hypothetical protein D5086_0000084180 [Populus alba]
MVVDGVYQTVVYESPRQVCHTCGRVGIAVQKLLMAKEIPTVRRRQAHIRIKFRRWNHHTAIVLQMTVVSTVRGYMLSLIHTIPDSAEAPSDKTGKIISVDVANDTQTKLPIAPNDEGRGFISDKEDGDKEMIPRVEEPKSLMQEPLASSMAVIPWFGVQSGNDWFLN